MSIVANKFKSIRCGLCIDAKQAKATREHNNSNVLALGCDYITDNEFLFYSKYLYNNRVFI